ncbi:MAG: hypothetical protein ACYC96_05490 [Fimbriimonadaceae bacterium]
MKLTSILARSVNTVTLIGAFLAFGSAACSGGTTCGFTASDALNYVHQDFAPGCNENYNCTDGGTTIHWVTDTKCLCGVNPLDYWRFGLNATYCDGTLMCVDDSSLYMNDTGNPCTTQSQPPAQ